MDSITTRFELPPGTPLSLLHNQQVLTIQEIEALSQPGKALKIDMISVLPPAYTPPAYQPANNSGWHHEPAPVSMLQQKAYHAKESARLTKEEAKKLTQHAKSEARVAKEAEKAFRQASKAANKAKSKAAADSQQASKHDKGAGLDEACGRLMSGKLVNVSHAAGSQGDLVILPCNRICFHCYQHPANLRVGNGKIQKGGGRGAAAQFEVVSTNEDGVYRLVSVQAPEVFLGVARSDTMDGALSTFSQDAFEFAPGSHDSAEGLWSFYEQGSHSPMELDPPEPNPTARDVYARLQEMVTDLAESTNLPISLGDAPIDESELVEMVNEVHDYLPHAIKRIAMKKLGIRKFDVPAPEVPEGWGCMLADLVEMGFEDEPQNLIAVREADGDLKKAIKALVQSSLFKH